MCRFCEQARAEKKGGAGGLLAQTAAAVGRLTGYASTASSSTSSSSTDTTSAGRTPSTSGSGGWSSSSSSRPTSNYAARAAASRASRASSNYSAMYSAPPSLSVRACVRVCACIRARALLYVCEYGCWLALRRMSAGPRRAGGSRMLLAMVAAAHRLLIYAHLSAPSPDRRNSRLSAA